MVEVNRKILEDFLNNVGCQTTTEVMKTLEPFYRMAEAGRINIAEKKDANTRDIKKAIKLGADDNIKKIVFIELSFPIPGWIPKTMWVDFFEKAVNRSLHNILVERYFIEFRKMFDEKDSQLRAWLLPQVSRSFFDKFRSALYALQADVGIGLVGNYVLQNYEDVLLYWIGFSLLNQTEKANELFPLVVLMGRGVLILGNKSAEKDTWLVLVA